MKYLLALIQSNPCPNIRIGRYEFIAYGGGTFTVRQFGSGYMSPEHKLSMAGLRKSLAWIDEMETGKGNDE